MSADHWVTGEWQGPMLEKWEWHIERDVNGIPLRAYMAPVQYVPQFLQRQLLTGCEEWLWRMTYREHRA